MEYKYQTVHAQRMSHARLGSYTPSLNFSLDWQLAAHMFALEGSQRKAKQYTKLNAVLKANAVVG